MVPKKKKALCCTAKSLISWLSVLSAGDPYEDGRVLSRADALEHADGRFGAKHLFSMSGEALTEEGLGSVGDGEHLHDRLLLSVYGVEK